MIISDLNYLEAVAQSERVEGGVGNILSNQYNSSSIYQTASANSGAGGGYYYGGGGFSALNTAIAGNVAAPVQVNL
jgi:hypothetical protein